MKVQFTLYSSRWEAVGIFAKLLEELRDRFEGEDWLAVRAGATRALQSLESGDWDEEKVPSKETSPYVRWTTESGSAGFRYCCRGMNHHEELVVGPAEMMYAVRGSRVAVQCFDGLDVVTVVGRRHSFAHSDNGTGDLAWALLDLKIEESGREEAGDRLVRVETQSTGIPREPWNLFLAEEDAQDENGERVSPPHWERRQESREEFCRWVAQLRGLRWEFDQGQAA